MSPMADEVDGGKSSSTNSNNVSSSPSTSPSSASSDLDLEEKYELAQEEKEDLDLISKEFKGILIDIHKSVTGTDEEGGVTSSSSTTAGDSPKKEVDNLKMDGNSSTNGAGSMDVEMIEVAGGEAPTSAPIQHKAVPLKVTFSNEVITIPDDDDDDDDTAETIATTDPNSTDAKVADMIDAQKIEKASTDNANAGAPLNSNTDDNNIDKVEGKNDEVEMQEVEEIQVVEEGKKEEWKMKLYIGNLPNGIGEDVLMNLFEPFAVVLKSEMCPDQNAAYVYLDNENGGLEAIKELNKVKLGEKNLTVMKSKEDENKKSHPLLDSVGTFKLFVKFKYSVTSSPDDLKDVLKPVFEEYGRVANIEVTKKKNSGKNRQLAFIDMEEESGARKAIDGLKDRVVEGFEGPVEVTESRTQEDPDIPIVKLHVNNFPEDCGAEQIRSLFQPYGIVLRCCITNKSTPLRKAVVHLEQLGDIRSAISELSEVELISGTKLKVIPLMVNKGENVTKNRRKLEQKKIQTGSGVGRGVAGVGMKVGRGRGLGLGVGGRGRGMGRGIGMARSSNFIAPLIPPPLPPMLIPPVKIPRDRERPLFCEDVGYDDDMDYDDMGMEPSPFDFPRTPPRPLFPQGMGPPRGGQGGFGRGGGRGGGFIPNLMRQPASSFFEPSVPVSREREEGSLLRPFLSRGGARGGGGVGSGFPVGRGGRGGGGGQSFSRPQRQNFVEDYEFDSYYNDPAAAKARDHYASFEQSYSAPSSRGRGGGMGGGRGRNNTNGPRAPLSRSFADDDVDDEPIEKIAYDYKSFNQNSLSLAFGEQEYFAENNKPGWNKNTETVKQQQQRQYQIMQKKQQQQKEVAAFQTQQMMIASGAVPANNYLVPEQISTPNFAEDDPFENFSMSNRSSIPATVTTAYPTHYYQQSHSQGQNSSGSTSAFTAIPFSYPQAKKQKPNPERRARQRQQMEASWYGGSGGSGGGEGGGGDAASSASSSGGGGGGKVNYYYNGAGKLMYRGNRGGKNNKKHPGIGTKSFPQQELLGPMAGIAPAAAPSPAASSSDNYPGTSNNPGVFRGGTGGRGGSTGGGGPSFATGSRGRGGAGGSSGRGGGYAGRGKPQYKTKQQIKQDNQEYSDWLQSKAWLHQAIPGTVRPAQ